MTDGQAPNPVLARAELARQVVENPIFTQAVEEMREELIKEWVEAKDGEHQKKDLLHRLIRMVYVFEGKLRGYIELGKAAQKAMEPMEVP